MNDQGTGGENPAPPNERTVTMTQTQFDATMGNKIRRAEERTREEMLRDQETIIKQKAEEIAEKKAEEVYNRKEEERRVKALEQQEEAKLAEQKKVAQRLTEEFKKTAKDEEDFEPMAEQYDWSHPQNKKILGELAALSDLPDSGKVLHYLMKENLIEKLGIRSKQEISKKIKEISEKLRENETIAEKKETAPDPVNRTRPSHIPKKEDGRPLKTGDFKGKSFRN